MAAEDDEEGWERYRSYWAREHPKNEPRRTESRQSTALSSENGEQKIVRSDADGLGPGQPQNQATARAHTHRPSFSPVSSPFPIHRRRARQGSRWSLVGRRTAAKLDMHTVGSGRKRAERERREGRGGARA